ncbi:MAG: PAS domain-containing protein [Verrucomicrobia bacterium]|nr:PAS domain-containing protein [Verrucomicrobiota bacterium]
MVMKKDRYYIDVINAVQVPILVIDREMRIVDTNSAARKAFGRDGAEIKGCPCHKVMHRSDRPCFESGVRCPVHEVFATGKSVREVHQHQRADGSTAWEEILASPLRDEKDLIVGVVEELRDLTETLQHRNLVKELQDQVRRLEGILPICSHCKRIRNAAGEWEEVESYVKERTDADFTHGICPVCVEKYYAEYHI